MDGCDIANHYQRASVTEHSLCRLSDKDKTAHDRTKRLLDEGWRDVGEWSGRKCASGRVDDAVEPAKGISGGSDNAASLVGVGEIGSQRCGFSTRLHSDRDAL